MHSAYLTGRQLDVWRMLHEGISQSEIARRLGISRQAVGQLAHSIPIRVTAALTDAAALNRVRPTLIDSNKGVLVGWSNEFRTETVITLNPKVGLRMWYKHDLGHCKICPDSKKCTALLLENAREFGVHLAKHEKTLEPSELSGLVFSRILGTSKTSAIP